jgi:hypothetical protein
MTDIITITISRRTADAIGLMIPNPRVLKIEALAAAIEYLEAIGQRLPGAEEPADEEEEEPEYADPR